ncbi:MAG: CaiB/BaiF CoA-transferase family protein [Pseudomonadota bacterium]
MNSGYSDSASSPQPAPLAGVRVLDLSWLLPGPFCTRILVDLGADVIKVERPEGGDYLREIMPAAHSLVNVGKRSVAIDLKSPEGKAFLDELLEKTDVMVEGFRPGVAARLGIDYASLSKRFPRLIYVSLSGYGQTGPLAHSPGHDINYLAKAGALAIPSHWGEAPRRSGLPVADLSASLYAAINILAALRVRDAGARGAHIDLSITDSVLHWSQIRYADRHKSGQDWNHVRPGNDVFQTSDGVFIALGLVEVKFWEHLAAACNWKEAGSLARTFEQSPSATARKEAGNQLRAELTKHIASRDFSYWEDTFNKHDVPFSLVSGYEEVFSEPQFTERGVVSHFDDPLTGERIKTAALPGGLYKSPYTPPPRLNEHEAEVRNELQALRHPSTSDTRQ